MGLPMARALLRAQIDTTGFDIRSDVFDGVPMQPDPAAFAGPLTHLLTVVRDETETEALLFGDQALLSRSPALEHLLICSTVAPAYVRALRDRVPGHIAIIDAPMSGAQTAAERGALTFMLGGAAADIDAVQLLLAAMGQVFHHMGPLGAGMTAKVLNNMVAAASTATTRLALDWGRQHGLDHRHLLEVMQTSSGQTWFGSGWDDIEFTRDGYADDNSIGLIAKDVAAAMTAAPDGAALDLPKSLIAAIRRLKEFDGER